MCVLSWDLYSWPGTGETKRFFEDHQPIFTETYLIAEDHETEVLEEIKASEPFHEAFIQTGEEALVSFEIVSSSGSRNEAVSDDSSNKSIFCNSSQPFQAPICDLNYPVIPEMADWSQMPFNKGGYSPSEHRIGALVVAATYWRDWIKGILPEGELALSVLFR